MRKNGRCRAWLVFLVTLGLVALMAPAGSASVPKAAVDTDGTLRIAGDIAIGTGIQTDVNGLGAPAGAWWGVLGATVLGAPVKLGKTPGTFEPWLAQSFKVVDPTHFELTLRKGLTYQDGEPYTAQHLADTILAKKALVLKGNLPGTAAGLDRTTLVIIDSIAVSGQTMTFTLTQPRSAVMPEFLSLQNGASVSPKSTDPNNPIGAGPYKFVSLDRSTKMVLKKWDGFFEADKYKIKNIEVVQATVGDAGLNALRAGQVDVATVDPTVAATLTQSGPYKVLIAPVEAYYWVGLCASAPPLTNVLVRQALNISVDRDEINRVLYGGQGKTQVGLWPKGDPRAVPAIESKSKPQIAKAKQLLAQAGVTNPEFTLVTSPAVAANVKISELLQAQWAKIGVKINIKQIADITTALYGASRQGDIGVSIWAFGGAQKLTNQFVAGAPRNFCNYTDPRFTALGNVVASQPATDPSSVAAWHDAQQIIYDQAISISTVLVNEVLGVNTNRVRGLKPSCTSTNHGVSPCMALEGAYLVKS